MTRFVCMQLYVKSREWEWNQIPYTFSFPYKFPCENRESHSFQAQRYAWFYHTSSNTIYEKIWSVSFYHNLKQQVKMDGNSDALSHNYFDCRHIFTFLAHISESSFEDIVHITYEKLIFYSEDYAWDLKKYSTWTHCKFIANVIKPFWIINGLIELKWTKIVYRKIECVEGRRCFRAMDDVQICPTRKMNTNTHTCTMPIAHALQPRLDLWKIGQVAELYKLSRLWATFSGKGSGKMERRCKKGIKTKISSGLILVNFLNRNWVVDRYYFEIWQAYDVWYTKSIKSSRTIAIVQDSHSIDDGTDGK